MRHCLRSVARKALSYNIYHYSIALWYNHQFWKGWEEAMVAYTKLQQRKKEESERLRGERDQIKFIHLRVDRWY